MPPWLWVHTPELQETSCCVSKMAPDALIFLRVLLAMTHSCHLLARS